MSNTADLDRALLAVLKGDAALAALLPDGVFFSVPPPKAQRFVLIRQQGVARYEQRQGGRAFQTKVYLIEAWVLSRGAPVDLDDAAARIDALLQDAALLLPPDLALMDLFVLGSTRDGSPNETDPSLQWYWQGGEYQLRASWPDTFTSPSISKGERR